MRRVIVVANEKGGSGKSTVSMNLATALARTGLTVIVGDGDPQGTLLKWAVDGKDNLEGYKPPFSLIGMASPAAMDSIASLNCDVLIIDCPAKAEKVSAAAIRVANLVIVPVQPSGADYNAVEPTVAMIDYKRNIGGQVNAAFVLTRTDENTKLTKSAKDGAWNGYGLPILNTTVGDREIYKQAMTVGITVHDMPNSSAAQAEFDNLVRELKELQWL